MKKLFSIAVLFFAFQVHAQNNCTVNLNDANKLLSEGNVQEAISLATPCTLSENETDQWKAYRFLAIAHLANNQPVEAKKAAENMREINPAYTPSVHRDPAALVKMLNDVKVIPKLSMIATTLGYNHTLPIIEASYNGADYTKAYSSDHGWSYGLVLGYSLNKTISLGTGLLVNQKNFQIDYQEANNTVKVKEKLNYLNIPLFARFYTEPFMKTRLFADVGIYGGMRTASQSDFSLNNPTTETSIELNNLNSDFRRSDWEYGEVFGAGIITSLNKFDIAVDFSLYNPIGNNITNKENRYENHDLVYNFLYLDDDILLRQLSVSLSLVYNVSYRVLKSKK